jgi:hypothetical protein
MHPLINDASQLSESELEEKIFKLNRVYHITSNEQTRHQIILALDTYKIALEEKRLEQKKLQQEQNQGNSDLDNLINVS